VLGIFFVIGRDLLGPFGAGDFFAFGVKGFFAMWKDVLDFVELEIDVPARAGRAAHSRWNCA
jgi:hypothetical protein